MATNERKILTTLALDGEKAYKAAMDSAYSSLRVLSSELKANSAEYATNEKSIEGLTKRGELLRKEIAQQKEIVEAATKAATEAAEAYGEDSKKADEYRIKLNNAKAALSDMETALKENNDKLATAKDKLKAVSDGLETISTKLKTAGDAMEKSGKKLTTHITAPLLGAAGAAVKLAADYEETINKINTLDLGSSQAKIQGISDEIKALSNETGTASTAIGEATYQMGSALGSLGDDVVGYVEIATKAAIGGFTDATTATNGLTTVFNTYGLTTTEEMQKISDQMLTAQNLGKTTFGEIAQSVGNVVPMFQQAGGASEELMASYAILTKNGIATSQATTGLKGALSNIFKPTKEAAEAAQALGLDFSAANIKAKGWNGMLLDINASLKKTAPQYAELTQTYAEQNATLDTLIAKKNASKTTDKALNDQIAALKKEMKQTSAEMEIMAQAANSPIAAYSTLFGSVEGLNSMLVLSSDQGIQQYNEALQDMEESTGATEAAYQKMQEGVSAQSRKVIQSVKNFGIELGDKLISKAKPALDWVKEMTGKLGELDDETQENILKWGAIAAAAGPVLIIFGKVTTALGSIAKAMSFVAANPMVLGIAAITIGAIALYTELTKTTDEMKAFEDAAHKAATGTDDFGTLVKNIEPNIADINELISSSGNTIADLKQTIDEKSEAINTILKAALDERRVLRDDEIKEISKYNQDIANANDELIEIYRGQQLAEFQKVILASSTMSVQEIEQFSANATALLDASNSAAEDIYSQRLVALRNQYQAMGELDSQEYQDALNEAKQNHDAMIAENQSYYGQTLTALTEAAMNLSSTQSAASSEQLTALKEEKAKKLAEIEKAYEEEYKQEQKYWSNMNHMDDENAQLRVSAANQWRTDQLAALQAEEQPWLDQISAKYESSLALTNSYYESMGALGTAEHQKAMEVLQDQKNEELDKHYANFQPMLDAINESYNAQYQAIYDQYGRVNELDSAEAQASLEAIKQREEAEKTALAESYDAKIQQEIDANAAITGERISWHEILRQDEENFNTARIDSWTNYLDQFKGVAISEKQARANYSQDFSDYLTSIEYMEDASFIRQYALLKENNDATTAEMDQHAKDILETFKGLPDSMQRMAMDVLRGESLGLQDPALRKQIDDEAIDVADDVVNAIWRVWDLGSPSRVAKGMGRNFVQGLEDGMNEKQESASRTAAGIGTQLVQTFKNIFGIRSPSTVMRDMIGKPMMQGWAQGITDNKDLVSEAFGNVKFEPKQAAMMLDVTRTFNDVARDAAGGSAVSYQSSQVTNSKEQTINQNNTWIANELSPAEQRRQAREASKRLVKELSASGI